MGVNLRISGSVKAEKKERVLTQDKKFYANDITETIGDTPLAKLSQSR